MLEIAKEFNELLVVKMNISDELGLVVYGGIVSAIMITIGIGLNWMIQGLFRWIGKYNKRVKRSQWHGFLSKRRLGHHILLLIPGIILYSFPYLFYERGDKMIWYLHRADIIYLVTVVMMILRSILYTFLDFYSTTDKNKSHPLKGFVQAAQVILYFIGGIIIVAILINKSPTVLLTGLGASAAVLMLIFKDSILGFVAGIQLSQNNMIRIGDWIQMPDGSANGTVEEITLNTVKVRNWDNTISMIPPYSLVSSPFKNWRGMQESEGRRADKCIFIDMTSLEICSKDMVMDICKAVPLLGRNMQKCGGNDINEDEPPTNIQLYRKYIELYLMEHPDVNQNLDLIITQKEATPYGLPIEVYFFIKDKTWANYEKKQSDIFDSLLAIAPEFGLRLYQRP